jgi:alkanesulfonate monooxygenase SsuD/methylene tetrahydromethanopterin reductase-like flavin-dependent oxidoreductase (luciferase family)
VEGARQADQLSRRLGLSIPGDLVPLSAVPAAARRAEELGWTDAWSFESGMFDAFTPLALAAAATERMRLGTAIAPSFLRPAGLLAMHAAAMAEAAPGRFVLGIGSSTQVIVEQWMGIPFRRPRTHVAQTLAAVRALLAGGRSGAFRLARPPAQPPEIWIAALGERMLELARSEAQGVCLFMVGPRMIATLPRDLDSMCRITVVPGDGDAPRALARRMITGYAIVPYYAGVMGRQGFGEEVRAINERWAAGDRVAATGQVSDAMVDELTLTGTLEAIRGRLEGYWEAGLGCPALQVIGTEIKLEALLEAMAEGVRA